MKWCWIFLAAILLPIALAEDEDYEDRLLHKKKKKKRPYYPAQASPCGFRDNGAGEDGRSVLAALGGAAVGYHLGQKQGHYGQQPVINNIINTPGGYGGGYGGGGPCGGGVAAAPLSGGGGGGLLGSHFGGGGLLASHLGPGGLLGSHLGGLTGPGGFGGQRNGVNWDRTIRQFNRQVVRPITRWF